MSSKLKKLALGGAIALATAAGVSTMTAGAAQAAPAASYNGVCGSGYSVIDQHSITGATIFLTYSANTGRNCVVTVRNTSGSALPMDAEVSLAGAPWNIDQGNYTNYAGPVYVAAANKCIDWGGGFNGAGWDAYSVHCG
jgi:hypothetical protein